MAFRYELPDIDDAYAMADWFEIMFLLYKKPQISRAQLSEALVAKLGSSPQELEVPISFLFSEIGRRRQIAGSCYPLIVDNTIIRFEQSSHVEFYTFLLLISLDGPMRKDKRYKEIDQIFDSIVAEAAKGYFGDRTNTLRFGWPPSGGRPSKFSDALAWLAEKTDIPVGNGVHATSSKDGGVDVVAWKNFSDGRTAFLVAFIQCTVQADWHPKAKDILNEIWRARLDTAGSALTSLAIPFVIPKNYDKWDDLRRMVNIVFDRLRLAQGLSQSELTPFKQMVAWNRKEIRKFVL